MGLSENGKEERSRERKEDSLSKPPLSHSQTGVLYPCFLSFSSSSMILNNLKTYFIIQETLTNNIQPVAGPLSFVSGKLFPGVRGESTKNFS